MKRCITLAPSGSQVAACVMFAATVPPLTPTWYQRGAAKPVVFARRTVWGTQSDSVPEQFVNWFCIMARIWSTSRRVAVPDCGALATAAFGHEVAARGVSGPVNVESEMLFQSAWNL